MILPYNAYKLADNRLRYDDIAHARHMNPALTRYELRRVWVVDSELNSGTTHLYKRRTFYVDEDTWTILAVDVYDRRDQLWRVQEAHSAVVPWEQAIAPSAGTVYDLQANRYLIMDLANEEPLAESMTFPENHFTTGNITRKRKIDQGMLEAGRPADIVFLDRPDGSSGKNVLEAMAMGNIPGIAAVMIDGKMRTGRSRSTPPSARVPRI